MLNLRQRFDWHRRFLGTLIGYRTRYPRWRGWINLLSCYAAHTMAGGIDVRTVRWSLSLPGDAEPVQLRLGSTDLHAIIEIYFEDEYGFALPVLKALRGGVKTVVDLGANAGYTVRLWCRSFPECRIIAVEPDAANLNVCLANVPRDRTADVLGVCCFAAGSAGVAYVDRTLGPWAYRMQTAAPATAGESPTAKRTVAEILSEAGLADATIDLLKCDIEGAEAEVFRGGPQWLRRVRAILAEVHAPYTTDDLIADVRSAGGEWSATTNGDLVLLCQTDRPEAI